MPKRQIWTLFIIKLIMSKIYMPGEFIKNKNEFQLGIGTYLVEDKIYATIKGTLLLIDN